MKIQFIYDSEYSGYLETVDKVFIPFCNVRLDIWLDRERKNQTQFSKKQLNVFENFLNINQSELENISILLESYFNELIEKRYVSGKNNNQI